MGKDWDKVVVGVDIWQECFRVLKSGAFAFIMSAPRQDVLSHMIVNLDKAGFQTGFTSIYWTYASGFPKASNIGKMVDKKLGAEREVVGRYQAPDGKTRWGGTNFSAGNSPSNPDNYDDRFLTTSPATPQAQALDGSYAGFQPKPAVEVILVCMKPLSEKTYVEQALKNQKGVTWLDEGRIPTIKNEPNARKDKGNILPKLYSQVPLTARGTEWDGKSGRFPANLLVSDDVLDDGVVHKVATNTKPTIGGKIFNASKGIPYFENGAPYNDPGSFSRYFDIDRWWAERVRQLPESVQRTFPFLIVPKASKAEKNRGCEELYWEPTRSGYVQIGKERWLELGKEEARIYRETGKRVSLRASGNIHSTVKALKLMSYLITLGSREGDVILDPFVGSGTTCLAAQLLGRRSIGIESEEAFCEISANRCRQMVMEF